MTYGMRPLLLCLLTAALFAVTISPAHADHLTPERVVGDKYTVILLLIPDEEEMRIRFIFRDMQTGKPISSPVYYWFSVEKENSKKVRMERGKEETRSGAGEFVHQFPEGGLYQVSLTFEVAADPGVVYRPDPWSLWVPGVKNNFYDRYPIGFTEVAGFITILSAFVIMVGSAIFKKIRGDVPSLSFFGIFGTDEDIKRRTEIIRKDRVKNKKI